MRTEKLCHCGCGRSLKNLHQRRMFSDYCIGAQEKYKKEQQTQNYARVLEKQKLNPKASKQADGTNADPPPRKVKLCHTCYNLSHNRPASGCPDCKLPYAND